MDKINYEYEIFFRSCMHQSKAGIYSRSEEIYLKREIKKSLNRQLAGNRELEKKLQGMDNIIEEVYRYIRDCETKKLSVDMLVKRWIKNL